MLFSTKRKWDKLMNAAPKPAPTVTTTTTATAVAANTTSEPISPTPSSTLTVRTSSRIPVDPKKRRVDEAEITSPTKFSIRAVSPSGSVRSTRSTVLTTTTDSKAHGTYAPWDRDAFLDRLKSYRFVDKWSAKPTVVNEVAWARRGWVCFDKNRVRCNTCRAELLVAVELDDEQTEDGRALVDRYGAMVVEEHDESCLWRRKGCDDTIYRLNLSKASIARPAFAARYTTLVKIRNEIPPSISYPEDVEPAALHYPSECMEEGPIFETAAMLALFGWRNDDPGIPSLVSCSACFRRLGLWLFRKKTAENGTEEDEASVCRLDLVGEHRDYCPWVNAASQGKEPGWCTMLRVLKQPSRGVSGAASVYSVASVASTHSHELTNEERDAEDNSKLQKLRRLKTLYFGKKKREVKKVDKEKEKEAETVPTTPSSEKD